MIKPFSMLLLLVAAALSAQAQDFDYAKPEELRGLKKIYIYTKADLKARNQIIEELEKAKLNFEVVDQANDAQVVLMLATGATDGDLEARTAPDYLGGVETKVRQRQMATGKGLVFIPNIKKPRLVMDFENTQETALEKAPAVKFVRDFIKLYKKVNENKK